MGEEELRRGTEEEGIIYLCYSLGVIYSAVLCCAVLCCAVL